MVIHSVYFWLKPNLAPAERTRFRAELGKLASIGTIERIHIGRPADLPVRAVTDRTFDWAMTLAFADGQAHNAYQVDPVHEAFVEACHTLWTRVQVFDSQD